MNRSHFMIWLVVFGVAAGFVLPAISITTQASGHTGPLPSDQVFEATDNISVWDRSVFTLRSDPSSANVQIPNAFVELENNTGKTGNLNKNPIAVYDPREPIDLIFDDARAGTGDFDGNTTELLRAHIDSDANVTARTFSGAVDLLTQENANGNATFEEVEPSASLDQNGEATFTDTLSQPGEYIYFLALNETPDRGFVVDGNGNLSVDGEVTVIGVEQVTVRTGDPQIAPPTRTIVKGQSATFTVAHPGVTGTENVTHVFALYNEANFT